MRIALLGGCVVALLGAIPVSRMKLAHRTTARNGTLFHPYLRRFLPPFLLWNAVTGSFPVFGAVYLQKILGLPLGKVGIVFAVSQLAQFVAVLAAPILSKRVGVARGVAIAQFGTAISVALIVLSRSLPLAVGLYIAYFAAQFMCSPGVYQLLMDAVPEQDRSTASAVQNLSGALCQMTAAALTGICIVRFGYTNVMLANAAFALLSAAYFVLLGRAGDAIAPDTEHKIALRTPEQAEGASLSCVET
jgi:predicted MFS family arabinose efflux permease